MEKKKKTDRREVNNLDKLQDLINEMRTKVKKEVDHLDELQELLNRLRAEAK